MRNVGKTGYNRSGDQSCERTGRLDVNLTVESQDHSDAGAERMPARSEGFTIALAHNGDARTQAAAALYRHNIEQTGIDDRAVIGAELTDPSGKIWGGIWGRTELGLLFLDMFFLPENCLADPMDHSFLWRLRRKPLGVDAREPSSRRAVSRRLNFTGIMGLRNSARSNSLFQDTPASSFARTCSNLCGGAICTNGCSPAKRRRLSPPSRSHLLPNVLLPFPSGKLGHRA